jgi:hypothetical protein
MNYRNGYERGFGTGLKPIGSDSHLTDRIYLAKRVHARRLANLRWQASWVWVGRQLGLVRGHVGEKGRGRLGGPAQV